MRVVFEFTPTGKVLLILATLTPITGGVEQYVDVYSFRAVQYDTATDWVQLALEIFCVVYIFFEFFVREALEVR